MALGFRKGPPTTGATPIDAQGKAMVRMGMNRARQEAVYSLPRGGPSTHRAGFPCTLGNQGLNKKNPLRIQGVFVYLVAMQGIEPRTLRI